MAASVSDLPTDPELANFLLRVEAETSLKEPPRFSHAHPAFRPVQQHGHNKFGDSASNDRKLLPGSPVDSLQALAEGAAQQQLWHRQILMAVLFALFLMSGRFIVGPQEKAIVLRQGKPVEVNGNVLLIRPAGLAIR